MDSTLGTVFYVLSQQERSRPRFVRKTYDCTQCHEGGMTQGIPGLIMRSVYPDFAGEPILKAGTFATTDHSPFSQRWGGWYVTGDLGNQHHMGNVICPDANEADKTDFAATASIANVDKLIDSSACLQNTSDAVALLVLAHQTHLHNLITRANYDAIRAIRESQALNESLGRTPGEFSQSTRHRIENACEPVVRAMLLKGEPALTDPISCSPKFISDFESAGPRDGRGRSLRDFDLHNRLFKYPCSYLIYSQQFDGMTPPAKTWIERRLWQILTGREDTDDFDYLSDADREAVLTILRETKQNLPAYWHARRTR
jgi:hypothetical protein